MNTKNTKTAVIILLIVANIFFIYNRIDLKIKSENIPSEMIDDAASSLNGRGLIADRNKIPAKKPVSFTYEGIYSDSIFDEIVKNFSGVTDEEFKDAGPMVMPAGRSYVAGDYRFIFLNSDYFKISIIEKSYIDAVKDFSVLNPDTGKTDLDEETERKINLLSGNGISGIPDGSIKKAENIIKNFVRKYQNKNVKLGFDIIGFEEDRSKNCECVWINQTVDGLPVDSFIVYIEIQDEKVKYFSGQWYFGEFIANHRWLLLDSVNILFKCLETDGNIIQENDRLEEMKQEYTVIRHAKDRFYLAPSWQIKFESGKTLSYNMIAGAKN